MTFYALLLDCSSSPLQISGLIFFLKRQKERKGRLLKLATELQEIKSRDFRRQWVQMKPWQNIGHIVLMFPLFPRDNNLLLSITYPLWHHIHGKLSCPLSILMPSSQQYLLPHWKPIIRFQDYLDTDSIVVIKNRRWYIFCFSL